MSCRTGTVYALCDRWGEPYYIGRTTRTAGERLGEHRREATRRGRRSAVHLRTLELVDAGEGPAIWVLESGIAIRNVERRERHWIGYGEGAGWRLLNYSGWAGSVLVASPAQRELQRSIAAAQPRDPAQRFLPYGAPEAVEPGGQVYANVGGELPF